MIGRSTGVLAALTLALAGCETSAPVAAAQLPAPATSPFDSPDACRSVVAAGGRAPRARDTVRVATWNLRWFPYGTVRRPVRPEDQTDVAWVACLLAWLDVEVVALEEIVQDQGGREAIAELLRELERLDGRRRSARFDDCPDDRRQHVGFLWDETRVRAEHVRTVAELNPAGGPCATQLRPGIGAYFRFEHGPDLHAIAVHLDSGVAARDFDHRAASYERIADLAALVAGAPSDRDAIVLGDFNTMGCSACEPPADAERELALLGERVARGTPPLRIVSPSARCSEYHGSRGALLDHVLATETLRELPRTAPAHVYGPCGSLACGRPSVRERRYLDAVSDHCPLVVSLSARDLD